VICGSVAVNRNGVRLGKGGGYADLELALLVEAGLVSERTVMVTTVHALQVVDEPLPETEHDFRVDLIVTPDEVIACGSPRRPPGVMWEPLDEAKIAAVPVLAQPGGEFPHGGRLTRSLSRPGCRRSVGSGAARPAVGWHLERGNGLLERLIAYPNPFRAAFLTCRNQRGGRTRHNASGVELVAQGVPSGQRF
jgi:hypothetical protein